jgi:hypothetical protein
LAITHPLLTEEGRNDVEIIDRAGIVIATGYRRVVFGDHGPYIEMSKENMFSMIVFTDIVKKGDAAWYDEYYTSAGAKIYWQKKPVTGEKNANPPKGFFAVKNDRKEGYADYKANYYYVSPVDVFVRLKDKEVEILKPADAMDFKADITMDLAYIDARISRLEDNYWKLWRKKKYLSDQGKFTVEEEALVILAMENILNIDVPPLHIALAKVAMKTDRALAQYDDEYGLNLKVAEINKKINNTTVVAEKAALMEELRELVGNKETRNGKNILKRHFKKNHKAYATINSTKESYDFVSQHLKNLESMVFRFLYGTAGAGDGNIGPDIEFGSPDKLQALLKMIENKNRNLDNEISVISSNPQTKTPELIRRLIGINNSIRGNIREAILELNKLSGTLVASIGARNNFKTPKDIRQHDIPVPDAESRKMYGFKKKLENAIARNISILGNLGGGTHNG